MFYLEEIKNEDFSSLNGVCLNKREIKEILSIFEKKNNTEMYHKIIEICNKNGIDLQDHKIDIKQIKINFKNF